MKPLVALAVLFWIATTIEGDPLLLYSTPKYIGITNITKSKGNNRKTVMMNFTNAPPFDYHYSMKKICWGNHELETIQCVSINDALETQDNKVETVCSGAAAGLAIDWYTDKIYWTDSDVHQIQVASMDGRNLKVLFWMDIDQPRAIKLAPMKGLMFWTDWGDFPKLERASMDGNPTSRKVLVSDDIYWPNGLAIDYEGELIYWIDGKLNFLDVIDFEGANRKRLVNKGLHYPYALALWRKKLFWTDWQKWSINSYDISSGELLKDLISKHEHVPSDLQVWDASKQTIIGSNRCRIDNGGCSHLCLLSSSPLGYSCGCPVGIKLISNTTCADGHQELLLIARRDTICLVYLDTPDYSYKMMHLNVRYSIAVDYDPVDDFIYWSDDEAKKIQRAKLDGTGQEDVVTVEIFSPDGIAIDWVARNIYWTDAGADRVELCHINSPHYRKVIVGDGLHAPRAIAVAPHLGWLFWSDWDDKNPKVERANLDGSDRNVIVSQDLGWPNGITLDFQNEKIYWCDAKRDLIEFANLDGSARMVLISNELPHPFGFSVMGDHIYWTDWQRRTIESARKDTGDQRRLIIEQMSNMMGLKAIKIGVPIYTNPCKNNGGCSQLCLYRHNETKVCACELGYELLRDNVTCSRPEAFLLFSKSTRLGIATLRDHDYSDYIPTSGIKHASSIDVEVDTNRIYWTDSKARAIMRGFLNGSDVEKVVEVGLGTPESLAIDWLGLNVYWTDPLAHRIEVARLVGTSRKTLLWEDKVYDPHALVLDPPSGYMYWSEWGTSNCIKKAGMDGSNLRQLLPTKGPADYLSLDYDRRRLYWIEKDAGAILSSDLDGNDRTVIMDIDKYNPIGLAVYRNVVYWSDNKTGYLMKTNIKTREVTIKQQIYANLTDLIVYQKKPIDKNPCSTSNGGCTHLCLAFPSKSVDRLTDYVCACPTHFSLKDNECIAPKEFMIYSQRNSTVRLLPGPNDCPEAELPIHGLKGVKAISFDPLNNFLYWIEGKTHSIKRAEAGGTLLSLVVHGGEDLQPYDLDVDPIGRLLFWTCAKRNVINITRLEDESHFGVVNLTEKEQPRLIALHPTKRLILYTDVGETPQLVRMRMDGTHRVVITKGGDIVSIAVDPKNDLVLWAHGYNIYVSNIDGESQVVLPRVLHNETNSRISQLTVHDGWVYWVDRELSQLQRFELHSSKSGPPISLQASHIVDVISVITVQLTHPCYATSGSRNCSHLCIMNGTNAVCSCPRGSVLKEDKRNCAPILDCGPSRFSCAVVPSNDKDCLPIAWRCDKHSDCPDGSDEKDCHDCPDDKFKCVANGECILKSQRCDGIAHCPNKSDEENCCKDGFVCGSTQVCILKEYVCDNVENCADGSDEHSALCASQDKLKSNSSDTVIYLIVGVAVALILIGFIYLFVFRKCSPNVGDYDQSEESLSPMQPKPSMNGKKTRKGFPVMRMSMLHSETSSYDRNNITGASSSTNGSSMGCYPRETLNPPPSPATTAASTRGSSQSSRYNKPYRHYRSINQPPPPTPCSTDVCDESDYNFPIRRYEDGPFPPPPTPRSHCQSESCPPSPSSRSSTYFSPLPPPPSPVASPPHRGYDS